MILWRFEVFFWILFAHFYSQSKNYDHFRIFLFLCQSVLSLLTTFFKSVQKPTNLLQNLLRYWFCRCQNTHRFRAVSAAFDALLGKFGCRICKIGFQKRNHKKDVWTHLYHLKNLLEHQNHVDTWFYGRIL